MIDMVDEKYVAKGMDKVIKKYEGAQMRIAEDLVRNFFSIKWLLVCIAAYIYEFGNEIPGLFNDGILQGLIYFIVTIVLCFGTVFAAYMVIFGVPKSILKYRGQLYSDDDFEDTERKN